MPQEPQELAANEWGTIIYHPQWSTLETGWFETRERMYAWLASGGVG